MRCESCVRGSGDFQAAAFFCVASICACAGNVLRADEPAPAWREQVGFSFGHRATEAAFSPDGKTLAIVGGDYDDTGIVKLFDVATHQERLSLDGHNGQVNAVAFSPDGKTLATGGGAGPGLGEIKLWDIAGGKLLLSLSPQGGYVLALAFSPDGKTLAAGAGHIDNDRYFGEAGFWDVASGQKLPLALEGAKGEVTALSYVAGGKQLVTSGSRFDEASGRNVCEVKLWDAADGGEQAVLFTSVGPDVDAVFFEMRALAVSADGKRIAGAGRDASQGDDAVRCGCGASTRAPTGAFSAMRKRPSSFARRSLATAKRWPSAASTMRFISGT
ncbi:MAG TPA: hypothetical protein VMV10_09780 [Pirellulales bacterium]|nr:hypothetical protein [Pirellulales bacterium]